jgi:hypothetical protein
MAAGHVLGWEDDPGVPTVPNHPVDRPVPDTKKGAFPSAIKGRAPAPGPYDASSKNFRYWVAADALRRVGDYWGQVLGGAVKWHSTVGKQLSIALDEGEDFNAFYDRAGLHFFHGTPPGGPECFSANSPDVVCHEFGHAVLDAIRPQLWDATNLEVPSFHESFGDMSAMLTELQLQSVRQNVITTTGGKLARSSRLSRLAEQLGWAIRKIAPDAVDADCLRNAANSFFYKDPVSLPPNAPANQLSSEPHSFSRVFTGAFLSALAGMYSAGAAGEAALQKVSADAGKLLVDAVKATPVVTAYYSQVAAHMIALAQQRFPSNGYVGALRAGFVAHGILSLQHTTVTLSDAGRALAIVGDLRADEAALSRMALSGSPYGLDSDLVVHVAAQSKRFAVASAAPDLGAVAGTSHDRAAAAYLEDLFRRGQVHVQPDVRTGREIERARSVHTHEVVREDDALILRRRVFDCGFGAAG